MIDKINKYINKKKEEKRIKNKKSMEKLLNSSLGFTKNLLDKNNDANKLIKDILTKYNSYFIINDNLVFYEDGLQVNDVIDNYGKASFFGLNRDEMFLFDSIKYQSRFDDRFPPRAFKTWFCYFLFLAESHNIFVFDKQLFFKQRATERDNFNNINIDDCKEG